MRRLAERWAQFWFAPVPTSTLAVFRIGYGLVVLVWAIALVPDALTFFSRSGVLGRHEGLLQRLGLVPSDGVVVALFIVLIAAAICIVIGYRTRLATAVNFVVLSFLIYRNPHVFNNGDFLLRTLGFFLMLAPAGAALSVDRWRTARGTFWDCPLRAPWGLRLIQVQVSVMYLFAGWWKLQGDSWRDGTAVAQILRLDDVTRFRVPEAVTDSLLMSGVLTYGTVAVELALAVLIWNRRARPWVIALGIGLHLSIEFSFAVGFFSTAVLLSYISFVPEDTMAKWLERARRRLARSRLGPVQRIATAGGADRTA